MLKNFMILAFLAVFLSVMPALAQYKPPVYSAEELKLIAKNKPKTRQLKLDAERKLDEILYAINKNVDTSDLVIGKLNEIRSLLASYYKLLPQRDGQYVIDLNRLENDKLKYYSERADSYLSSALEIYSAIPTDATTGQAGVGTRAAHSAVEKLVVLGCRTCHEWFAPNKYNQFTK